MPETPTKSSLLPHLTGFALALTCAVWAGTKFALTGSSIGYGALTGLSFGAMFAFGQRVKQRLFPTPESGKWKIADIPSAANLRPAQRAAALAKPLMVECDASHIKTMRASVEHDILAWQDIEQIVISIGDKILPTPHWLLISNSSGMRIPNDTAGLDAAMEQFKVQLPGYDSDATDASIIQAMGAMRGDVEIWRRSATGSPPSPTA
jgi:hypothetical protein